MQRYDFQMIEGCGVYSYAVECPARRPVPKKRPAKSARPLRTARRDEKIKKLLLRMLFILLSPFALVLDAVVFVIRAVLHFGLRRPAVMKRIGTFSCLFLLSALLLL